MKNISVAGVKVQLASKRESALVRLGANAAAGSSSIVIGPVEQQAARRR